MGLVWRAWDVALHREVALKEVRAPAAASHASDPTEARVLRERVLREARALARLQHPNVVSIYHIVDSAELQHPWLVMELVSGGSLEDRLRYGPLPVQDAIRIARGVLTALSAAHAAGIQHRDVKPGNVLLRRDGAPVLTDFGIAALTESPSLTRTGTLIGSPEYMAPERIRGEEGNPASDLWSLGMLLYVAVEGHSPLRRESVFATLAAVLDAPIPPPVRSGPLAPVLAAMLSRDPAARPDAAALDRMLAAAGDAPAGPADAGSRPPTGYQHQLPAPRARGSSRPGRNGIRRTPLIAGAAAIALLGVLSWFLTSSSPPTSHDPARQTSPPPAISLASQGASAGRSPGSAIIAPSPADGQDLLTSQGVRMAIKALRGVTGGTKFLQLVIYSDFVTAEAPTTSDPTVYDNYIYRDGTASDASPGEALTSSDVLFDADAISWDKLPSLIKTADTRLGVAHPTKHYIIVFGAFLDTDPEPSVMVYASDSYRNAYLVANSRGDVVRMAPFTPSSG
jgi:eukaryotic-like serine/threonine-protein kinase